VERADSGARVPAWATHYLLLFNLDSFAGAGDLWIDDLLVTQM
jgi:hypothetical protein